jgi:hypothetical protein
MSMQVTDVQKALSGADYPASGDELAELARRNGGDDELIEELSRIDGELSGPDDVMRALKGSLGGTDED